MTEETRRPPVGDVTSQERGSGARYNANKPPLDLIPVHVWAKWECALTEEVLTSALDMEDFYESLHHWQSRQAPASRLLAHFTEDDMEEAARVLDYGRRKYAAWNWAKGMPWSVPVGCILRHCLAISREEETDPESCRSHWGHVLCNVIMLVHFEEAYPEGDDRPPAVCWGLGSKQLPDATIREMATALDVADGRRQ